MKSNREQTIKGSKVIRTQTGFSSKGLLKITSKINNFNLHSFKTLSFNYMMLLDFRISTCGLRLDRNPN